MPSSTPHGLVLLFLIVAAAITVYSKKLTGPGAAGGVLVGWCIFLGADFTGLLMLTGFFICSTAATSWQKDKKEKIKKLHKQKGGRTLLQVLANGGAAALYGALAYMFPEYKWIFCIMMASALSAATADTLSSELGTLYGKRFFNITSLRPDERGMDGAISWEGLGIGLIGSSIIALIFVLGYPSGLVAFAIIVAAGTTGNLADSLMGALLERKGLLGNDAVNFTATVSASICGGALLMATRMFY